MYQVYSDGEEPVLLGVLTCSAAEHHDGITLAICKSVIDGYGGYDDVQYLELTFSKRSKRIANEELRHTSLMRPPALSDVPINASIYKSVADDSTVYTWKVIHVDADTYDLLFDHESFVPDGDAYGWIDEASAIPAADWAKYLGGGSIKPESVYKPSVYTYSPGGFAPAVTYTTSTVGSYDDTETETSKILKALGREPRITSAGLSVMSPSSVLRIKDIT